MKIKFQAGADFSYAIVLTWHLARFTSKAPLRRAGLTMFWECQAGAPKSDYNTSRKPVLRRFACSRKNRVEVSISDIYNLTLIICRPIRPAYSPDHVCWDKHHIQHCFEWAVA